jgi:hypothetical protein
MLSRITFYNLDNFVEEQLFFPTILSFDDQIENAICLIFPKKPVTLNPLFL